MHDGLRRNIPLFIAFRVLFNARWYYPVLAVLFLDLGLTVGQYTLLNVAWAAAIVFLEVPSGALADYVGRRKMVIYAAILMLVEMAVFAFAPRGNPTLLFWLFLLNRILSGAAEASASGADEALAYDSLVAEGKEKEWPRVLDLVMRWQSVAFFVVMMAGAAVYDEGFLNRTLQTIGLSGTIPNDIAVKLPILLTLANAVFVLPIALAMREPPVTEEAPKENPLRATLAAGRWIYATPLAFIVILCGLCFDSVVRLFLTFQSTYFRIIELPTASFGIIGSAFALLGFIVPMLAKKMVVRWPMRVNFAIIAVVIFTGLIGASFVLPWSGLAWMVPLAMAGSFTQFFISHYLNQLVTDSRRRATVLSFRGLAFNLAYGGIGLLFAGLTKHLASDSPGSSPDTIFGQSLGWLPWYFLVTLLILGITAAIRLRRA